MNLSTRWTILKTLTLLQRSLLLVGVFLALCQTLNSCSHTPKPALNLCVADSDQLGYQCVDSQDQSYYLSFESQNMICSAPDWSEIFFKACKRGQNTPIPLCSYRSKEQDFLCSDGRVLSLKEIDNYLCFSKQHRQRMLDRCHLNQ
jgi:hypothetical protein